MRRWVFAPKMKTAQHRAVENWWYALGVFVVVGVIRPLLWWILLSLSLWIGRMFLDDRWGRIVFGRYWRPNRNISISDILNGIDPPPSNAPRPREIAGLPSNPLDR